MVNITKFMSPYPTVVKYSELEGEDGNPHKKIFNNLSVPYKEKIEQILSFDEKTYSDNPEEMIVRKNSLINNALAGGTGDYLND